MKSSKASSWKLGTRPVGVQDIFTIQMMSASATMSGGCHCRPTSPSALLLPVPGRNVSNHVRLEGQNAIVTGAAGALGHVIASTLAAEGASVAALDLNPAGLAETVELVEGQGGRACSATVDLTDYEAVQVAVGTRRGAGPSAISMR
jgi:hypothetical protein